MSKGNANHMKVLLSISLIISAVSCSNQRNLPADGQSNTSPTTTQFQFKFSEDPQETLNQLASNQGAIDQSKISIACGIPNALIVGPSGIRYFRWADLAWVEHFDFPSPDTTDSPYVVTTRDYTGDGILDFLVSFQKVASYGGILSPFGQNCEWSWLNFTFPGGQSSKFVDKLSWSDEQMVLTGTEKYGLSPTTSLSFTFDSTRKVLIGQDAPCSNSANAWNGYKTMKVNGYRIEPESDLSDANLINANLRNADLRNASLFDADLTGAVLEFANLTGANLNSAYLIEANLTGAALTDADLQFANLRNANLRNANLSSADLSMAFLGGINLEGANLNGAILKTVGGAYLHGANLKGASLCRTYLPGADLGGADLESADLIEAILDEAWLKGANLTDANLKGASLMRTELDGANLTRANLEGLDLTRMNLETTNMTNANLKGANLGGAWLRHANLERANLTGANLDGANLTFANLKGATMPDGTIHE